MESKEDNAVTYSLTGQGNSNNSIPLNGEGSQGVESASGNLTIIAQAVNPCPPASKTVAKRMVGGNDLNVPNAFALRQNMPNPFNPSTVINYQIPSPGRVELKVFNVLGQGVATIVDELESAGYKSAHFDATGLPSGVYFYRLKTGTFSSIRKMIYLK